MTQHDDGRRFFPAPASVSVADLAERLDASVLGDGALTLVDAATLTAAGPSDLSFFDNPKYRAALESTKAGAVLCRADLASALPDGCTAIVADDPYRAFARALGMFYPDALRDGSTSVTPLGGLVDPEAALEEGVSVGPGAVIEAGATIGSGTVIGPGAVVRRNVTVGRDCTIGANAVLSHCHLGNSVIVHPNVTIGADGFGFAMGAQGHLKVPQVGRVIVQDDVEIGANTAIDRGALSDTVVGEGTKIDNLVQIGHNVRVGRHCVIVSQVALAGSCSLGDYVVIGGKSGVAGHVTVGAGAQIAAVSNVHADVAAGARVGGTPARPIREWMRQIAALEALARPAKRKAAKQKDDQG